eukprot:222582-Chlamydomonas_euryale.AAC.7
MSMVMVLTHGHAQTAATHQTQGVGTACWPQLAKGWPQRAGMAKGRTMQAHSCRARITHHLKHVTTEGRFGICSDKKGSPPGSATSPAAQGYTDAGPHALRFQQNRLVKGPHFASAQVSGIGCIR